MKQGKPARLEPSLGLWDGVSIIVGIVVGVGIFRTPSAVFSNVASAWQGMAVWLFGGALSLVGALCYAELATAYPRLGGDYVYLTRAYGPLAGFMFGWAQLAAIMTGSCGSLAYVFADYGVRLWSLGESAAVWLALAAVLLLTGVNLCGIVFGKTTQNVLTAAKVAGIAAVLAAGLLWGTSGPTALAEKGKLIGPGLGVAMIMVLFTYGGWNDAAFVAAEIRDGRRNIPRALIIGTLAITAIYLLTNAAYLWGLGFDRLRRSTAPAADLLARGLGQRASAIMCVLVMISALGALNGNILTGARIYAALGSEHSLFHWLGRWHPRLRTPICALVAQAAVAAALIVLVGTAAGRAAVDACLTNCGLKAVPWKSYGGGFDTLVSATAPVFWFFFMLTGISLFVLRDKEPGVARPFKVPFYPFTPLIFCGMCSYMFYSSLVHAKGLALMGIVPLLVGLPLFLLSRHKPSEQVSGLGPQP